MSRQTNLRFHFFLISFLRHERARALTGWIAYIYYLLAQVSTSAQNEPSGKLLSALSEASYSKSKFVNWFKVPSGIDERAPVKSSPGTSVKINFVTLKPSNCELERQTFVHRN